MVEVMCLLLASFLIPMMIMLYLRFKQIKKINSILRWQYRGPEWHKVSRKRGTGPTWH